MRPGKQKSRTFRRIFKRIAGNKVTVKYEKRKPSKAKCGNCGKGIMYGHNVSHSKRRTRRIFKPNLHTARVEINGIMKRMKLCAKCMRLLKGKSTRDVKAKAKSLGKITESMPQSFPAV